MSSLVLKFTNTLSRKLETFEPLDNKKIGMYVCGPTVYDKPHIGNARSNVVYDILYRTLIGIYGFDNITYVRNLTDIDDKIINRSLEEKIDIYELTNSVTEIFHNDCDYLNCLRPNHEPKATEFVDQMIDIISKLIDAGHAYIANNHVYFDVNSYNEYGKLAGRDLEKLIDGARINVEEAKKNPADFVLWKPDNNEKFSFQSPFGMGRPGWHIECSAMSHNFLGTNFDIHGGGADLMFPHHTNEIAQSCCAFKGSKYAKYWIHNGFLTSKGEKMSKSLGNFVTTSDIRDSGIDGEQLRLLLLGTHYRSPLDYNDKSMSDSKMNLDYLYRTKEHTENTDLENISFENLDKIFKESLLDDLNTHKAITRLLEIAKIINKGDKSEELHSQFISCANFIGILNKSSREWFKTENPNIEIENLINKRNEAKLNKDFDTADKIREELSSMGITLEDSANGTKWRKT